MTLSPEDIAPMNLLPPQDLEAERAVLGGIMVNPDCFPTVAERITSEAFYKRQHSDIFAAMSNLSIKYESFTPISIRDELARMTRAVNSGTPSTLIELMDAIHTSAGIEAHCDIVMEKFVLRQLIRVAGSVSAKAYGAGADAQELLTSTEAQIYEIIRQGFVGDDFQHIGKVITDSFPTVESLMPAKDGMVHGAPSPFIGLDRMTCGWQNGNLILVAGRPSMGKTSLALNLAHYLASCHNIPVGIFSLEQSADELATRLICAESNVGSQKLRTGRIRTNDLPVLKSALKFVSDAPIYLDDTGENTMRDIRAKARQLKSRHGIKFLVIDYLQLIETRKRASNREQEVSAISRGLKGLAKDLDIPVMALSQLSRALEARDDKRPRLSDLRESGALEQDCDVCIFLYRPEVYSDDPADAGVAEAIIAKQRNGPIGTINIVFQKGMMRFDDIIPAPKNSVTSTGDLFV